MARKEKIVTITADGRDKGKVFHIRETPCDFFLRWSDRALIALANAGAKLPEGALEAGAAGLELSLRSFVLVGLQAAAGLSWRDVEPLLDEMRPSVTYCPPGWPKIPSQHIFAGEESQVEEVSTWYTLRFEWLQLHLGFLPAGEKFATGSADPQTSPAS